MNQDMNLLSAMMYYSQAFPPETAHLGISCDSCSHGICGKNRFLPDNWSPLCLNSFILVWRKLNKRTSFILNYQKVVSDTYIYSLLLKQIKIIIQIGSKILVCFLGIFCRIFEPMYIVGINLWP